jgi:hypothetical protein
VAYFGVRQALALHTRGCLPACPSYLRLYYAFESWNVAIVAPPSGAVQFLISGGIHARSVSPTLIKIVFFKVKDFQTFGATSSPFVRNHESWSVTASHHWSQGIYKCTRTTGSEGYRLSRVQSLHRLWPGKTHANSPTSSAPACPQTRSTYSFVVFFV